MRRIAPAILLFFALTLALAACGSTATATGGTSPTATTAVPTDTPAPPAATDTPASGGGTAASATISMGSVNFDGTRSVTIKAGQAVKFDDPADSGGFHILVTGKDGAFTAAQGAPTEFSKSDGITFGPGDSKTIVFPHAGTFTITCMVHPSMLATITVK